MEPDRAGGGIVGRQAAGQQRRRHTGQHIAAAAPGEARVAGGVDTDPPIRPGDHGPRSLQHHDRVPLGGIPPGDALPISLDRLHRKPGQPGHLARVGCQDQLFGRAGQFLAPIHEAGGGVQAVGVQHRTARKTGEQLLHQRPRLGGAGAALGQIPQPRPDEKDGGLLPEDAGDALGRDAPLCPRLTGAETAFRQAGRYRRHHRLDAGQRDDARAGAQGTLHGQRRSAPVAGTARHRQHRPEAALVALAAPLRDAGPDRSSGDVRCHAHASP